MFCRTKMEIACIIEIQFSLGEIPQNVGRFSIVGTLFLAQCFILSKEDPFDLMELAEFQRFFANLFIFL